MACAMKRAREMGMNIVNIINFVRGCEPRMEVDLVEPVREELRLCRRYGYENTLMLQYDAMEREDILETVAEEADSRTELGIWLEMCRSLAEQVGICWRGRTGYDWDWYVDPGFLVAYSLEERERLIDAVMEKFHDLFGSYPRSAGSWILDSHSMEYMWEQYGVKAFCICREQYGVDAYSLAGGYYNQGYYPSRWNCICPASTAENQIPVPVFRMLGPDPVYNYGSAWFYEETGGIVPTIEPASPMGRPEENIAWFFRTYFEHESLAFSYLQLGQENSFGWEQIETGLKRQFEKLKKYQEQGICTVKKLGDTGEWFRAKYARTPPTSLIADSNLLEAGLPEGGMQLMGESRWQDRLSSSIWYNCIHYRANVVTEGKRLYIRDIYKFDELYREPFHDTPCRNWEIFYDNLPVMDGFQWRCEETNRAGIYFDGEFQGLRTRREGEDLVVEASFTEGDARLVFSERQIAIWGERGIRFVKSASPNVVYEKDKIIYCHNGYPYTVGVQGAVHGDGAIEPHMGKIVLELA